jgi:hypothetical protein
MGSEEDARGVRVHDFLIPEHGRAIPYGVHDLSDDAGWVSAGVDHDAAGWRPAATSIRRAIPQA